MKRKIRKSSDNTVARDSSPYFSARDLAERWRCSRTSVQRIAKEASIGKVVLGNGKHGSVRYVRADVERYEQTRQV